MRRRQRYKLRHIAYAGLAGVAIYNADYGVVISLP